MFDIGFSELLVVAVVALVVLGPERLPKAARFAGLWVRSARAQWYSVKSELEHELAADELKRSLPKRARRCARPKSNCARRDVDPDRMQKEFDDVAAAATAGVEPGAATAPKTASSRSRADAATRKKSVRWNRRATWTGNRRSPPTKTTTRRHADAARTRRACRRRPCRTLIPPYRQRLVDHLIELRSRLLRGAGRAVAGVRALLPFADQLYDRLAAPLLGQAARGPAQLIAIESPAPFFAPMKLAFFAALLVAVPWLLYQAWAFVAPGLYQREKRLALPLLASAVVLFYAGCAFAYFLVLPAVFGFLDQGHARGGGDDDRHRQVPRFRAGDLPGLRRELRAAGGAGDPGAAGLGDAGAAARMARLRGGRHLRRRRGDHAAGRGFAADAGDPDVLLYEAGILASRFVAPKKAAEEGTPEA